MAGYGFSIPSYISPGQRYVQLLNAQPSPNNGTVAGEIRLGFARPREGVPVASGYGEPEGGQRDTA